MSDSGLDQAALAPWDEEERRGAPDFYRVLEAHREALDAAVLEAAMEIPVLRGLVGSSSPEQEAAQAERSIRLQREAILEDRWEPYVSDLRAHGVHYAKLGVALDDWQRLIRAFRTALLPKLVAALAAEPERLSGALLAMNRWLDIAMVCITDAYVGEKQGLLRRHAELADSVSDAVIGVGLDFTVRAWNAGAQAIYGWAEMETLGRPLFELVPAEGWPGIAEVGARVARDGRWRGDLLQTAREGRHMQVVCTVSAIDDPETGARRGYVVVNRDVTGEKLAESKLKIAVEAAPCGIVMVDAAGTIVLANAETERLFGYSKEELLGAPIDRLVPERSRAAHAAHRGDFAGAPAARQMGAGRDLMGVRKDGDEIPLEIGLNPIQTPDGVLVLATIIDISDRVVLLETLAERTRRLRRSNADLEQFAYVAAHDLREPLRAVSNFTSRLQSRYADVLDERGNRYAAFAQEGALRMQRMIEDLLAYARLGRDEGELGPVSLEACVTQAQHRLARLIEETGAQLEVEDLPVVRGDEQQLVSLFQNLFDNAIKFRSAAPPRVRVSAQREGEGWQVSVRDNGLGIPAEHEGRIFQVFRRLHAQEDFPGTGIGLALCKRVVEEHGGTIRLESDGVSGSTFHFTLATVDPPTQRRRRSGPPDA